MGRTPKSRTSLHPGKSWIPRFPTRWLITPGIVWIQWRVENVHIVPVFGKGALNVSPRIGYLHMQVDDVPRWWADASDINPIDVAGMPPGPHRIRIELVNANHEIFPGRSRTVTFTIPAPAKYDEGRRTMSASLRSAAAAKGQIRLSTYVNALRRTKWQL